MAMKPQSKLLKFYEENLSRFEHFPILPDLKKKDVEKILQDSAAALPALNKLCENNEELMFVILQGFLAHILEQRNRDKREQPEKIKKAKSKKKNLPRNIEGFLTRLTEKSFDYIQTVKFLDPKIDDGKLRDKALLWSFHKAEYHIQGIDKYAEAIDFVQMLDPDIDCRRMKLQLHKLHKIVRGKNAEKEPSGSFNDLLNIIFSTCKDRTKLSDNAIYTNISNLLNSLNILSDQGKAFTRQNIEGRIKRTMPSIS